MDNEDDVNNHPLVSIIIPTKNAEKTIEKCLQTIFNQKIRNLEVIVIDSGSTDSTLEIIKKYPVVVKEISPYQFSHGYARNLGAELAKGDVLVYLNQDAIPRDESWLKNLLEPLKEENIVASYSRQIPYQSTHPIESFFILKTYHRFPRIHTAKNLYQRSPEDIVLWSTVSGSIKKSIWEKFRFCDNIIMSEDQELATRLLESGYEIAYQPNSVVMHSHNYSILDAFRRYFDSGWSIKEVLEFKNLNVVRSVRYCIILIAETLGYIIRYVDGKKFYWFFYAFMYILAKILGFALGMIKEWMPKNLTKNLSHNLLRIKMS